MKNSYRPSSQRRVTRDYARRRYGNPLFAFRGKQGPSNARRTAGRIIMVAVPLLAITAALWYAGWGPAFRIGAIDVVGASPAFEETARDLISKRMSGARAGIFPQSSIFFFDRDAALADIKAQFALDKIELRKKLPNSL
ncbi:MAG: hypothetical protein AAB692_02955, partial [Patescibacteria group bacterium]